MDVTVEPDQAGGSRVVAVAGDVDLWSVDELRRHLGQVQPTTTDLIVDLSKVSFIDSTGIGVLVSCLQDVKAAGGQMGLVVTQPHVQRVLQVTNLDQVFRVGDDRGAVEALITQARASAS